MRNMKAWVIGGLAVLVGVAFWQPASGGEAGTLVGGGKKPESDCYVELQAFGFDSTDIVTSTKGSTVTCVAGRGCDQGPADDAQCDIAVKVCINQTDPSLPSCTAPSGLDKLKLKAKGKNKRLIDIQLPSALEGSFCFGSNGAPSSVAGAFGASGIDGAFIIELPAGEVKNNGKLSGGTLVIAGSAKAVSGTSPRKDPDKFTIECRPPLASPSGAFLY